MYVISIDRHYISKLRIYDCGIKVIELAHCAINAFESLKCFYTYPSARVYILNFMLFIIAMRYDFICVFV